MEFGDSIDKWQHFFLQLCTRFSHEMREFGKRKLLVSHNRYCFNVTKDGYSDSVSCPWPRRGRVNKITI